MTSVSETVTRRGDSDVGDVGTRGLFALRPQTPSSRGLEVGYPSAALGYPAFEAGQWSAALDP